MAVLVNCEQTADDRSVRAAPEQHARLGWPRRSHSTTCHHVAGGRALFACGPPPAQRAAAAAATQRQRGSTSSDDCDGGGGAVASVAWRSAAVRDRVAVRAGASGGRARGGALTRRGVTVCQHTLSSLSLVRSVTESVWGRHRPWVQGGWGWCVLVCGVPSAGRGRAVSRGGSRGQGLASVSHGAYDVEQMSCVELFAPLSGALWVTWVSGSHSLSCCCWSLCSEQSALTLNSKYGTVSGLPARPTVT